MSTSCVIAEGTPQKWKGTYVHLDGYPEAMSKHLVRAVHEQFGGDIRAMLDILIGDNQYRGWSEIVGTDMRLMPMSMAQARGLSAVHGQWPKNPISYAFDDPDNWSEPITDINFGFANFAYVFDVDARIMYVLLGHLWKWEQIDMVQFTKG